MYISTFLVGMVALLTTASAAPTNLAPRQSASSNIGLYINGSNFDINYLQTYRLQYANTSAYLGEVKYQSYAEPLVVNSLTAGTDGFSFLSIHSSPTGFQQMYVVPHKSQPIGFSVPHGGPPAGVRTTGFSFGARGQLLNNNLNLFFACQDEALADLHAYQIYWMAGRVPEGMTCRGPIKISAGDACSRY